MAQVGFWQSALLWPIDHDGSVERSDRPDRKAGTTAVSARILAATNTNRKGKHRRTKRNSFKKPTDPRGESRDKAKEN